MKTNKQRLKQLKKEGKLIHKKYVKASKSPSFMASILYHYTLKGSKYYVYYPVDKKIKNENPLIFFKPGSKKFSKHNTMLGEIRDNSYMDASEFKIKIKGTKNE